MRKLKLVSALISTTVIAYAAPASAQTGINLVGTVVNLCVLTLSTPGVLQIASSGVELGSAQTGGVAAALTVVATGAAPTITFSAPSLSGPSSSGATTQLAYASTGGASRAYDTTGYTYAMNRLLDTITINGRSTNATGFSTGAYTINATATCSQ